jgi:hypothetical protein
MGAGTTHPIGKAREFSELYGYNVLDNKISGGKEWPDTSVYALSLRPGKQVRMSALARFVGLRQMEVTGR